MPLRLVLTLLLVAHLSVAVAPAAPWGAVVAQRGDCCDPPPAGDDDDCCPNGCHHCSLPCCGGSFALVGSTVIAASFRPDEAGLLQAPSPLFRGADPRRIYHPPR